MAKNDQRMSENAGYGTVPVLVLGVGLTVLGTVRCLGRKRIPLYCISEGVGFESHSRWFRKLPHCIGTFASIEELKSLLEKLAIDRAVLIPCSDHWAMELTKMDDETRQRFPFCEPHNTVLSRIVNKRRLYEQLRELGIHYPRTEVLRDEADVIQFFENSDGDCFLKPVDSQRFNARFKVKAFRVDSKDQAVQRYRQARDAGCEVMFQEYIPGPPTRHHFIDGFVDCNHQVKAFFARQRIRMHPPDFGNSSYVVSEKLEVVKEAIDGLTTLFEALKYRGIFSAEFKYDDRDHHFKLLEINCRAWWYVEFAAVCGVNVVEMAYRDALGLPVPEVNNYRTNVGLVFPYYDHSAYRLMRNAGTLSSWSLLNSWIHSRKALFCLDDPLPYIAAMMKYISTKLRK